MSKDFDTRYWSKRLHAFQEAGLNILLDINSGSLHVIDDLGWDVFKCLEHNKGSAEKTVAEMGALYSEEDVLEVLVSLLKLEAEGWFNTPPPEISLINGGLKALCLNVSHDCNLRCGYCFAQNGSFGGRKTLMSREVGERSMDLLLRETPYSRVEVDFFGGEPLMNFEVVQHITRYGNRLAKDYGKEIRFSLTTNGVLLREEERNFLRKEHFQVIMSLDGRSAVHDALRFFPGGKGSHEVACRHFKTLVQEGVPGGYYIRGTFTRRNPDFANDVRYLVEEGFQHVSMEPVVGTVGDLGFFVDDLPRIMEEYRRLAGFCLERSQQGIPFDFFHFRVDPEQGLCLARRQEGCGAGFQYLAVTPDGHIFPCHQFIGVESLLMGNVWEGVHEEHIQKTFANAWLGSKKGCADCWARFFCGGGCHAQAYHINGELNLPEKLACELEKGRLEISLYVRASQRLREREL